MLQAIIDFFKSLFGGLSTSKKTKPKEAPTTTTSYPKSNLPKVNEAEPQDGSEITADNAVVVIQENDPIIETSQPIDDTNTDFPPGTNTAPEVDDEVITTTTTTTTTTTIAVAS